MATRVGTFAYGPGRLCLALVFVLVGFRTAPALATSAAAPAKITPLGEVRRIVRGLAVAPPKLKELAGRVQQPLYQQYGLQTRQLQLASTGFADGTILYMNQNTSAILSTPAVTQVKKGEVGQT